MKYLTKSRFKQGLECPIKLTSNYKSSEKNDDFLAALADGGLQVEELSRLHYKNGVLIVQDFAASAYAGNLRLIIGIEQNANNGFVSGSELNAKLDDFSVWSKVLSLTEVQNYYNTSPIGLENNLEIYYDFEQGSGVILTDVTNHGNDAAIFGGALFSNDVPYYNSYNLIINLYIKYPFLLFL
jgi:hypothetical protein